MSQSKAEAIVTRMLTNAAGLKYGAVSVVVKIHDGRCVEIMHSVTESTRESDATKAKR